MYVHESVHRKPFSVHNQKVRCLNAKQWNAERWNAEQRRNAEQQPNAECPECQIPG
jgi:hypothetical protein